MKLTKSNLSSAWTRLTVFGDGPRSEFLLLLAGLVEAGIPVYASIGEMAEVFGKAKDRRALVMRDIMRSHEEGQMLFAAMRPWLAPHETMILEAGKLGVELGAALRIAASLTESRKRITGAVAGSMGYPAVLLVIGIVMLLVFSYQVIPVLSQLIPVEKWTGLGLFYHGLSSAVRNHGLLMLLAAGALLAGAAWSLPHWKPGRVRKWLDRSLPPWNLYWVYQGAVLLVSISAMIRSGVPMYDAVKIMEGNHPDNPWLRVQLAQISRTFEEGRGIRLAALDHPIFPTDVRISIVLFDQLPDSDKAMARLGVQALESAEKTARKIGATANAAVLVLVGMLVGGVIPALMGIMMDFYTQFTTGMRM